MSMIIVTDSSSDIRGKEIDELNIKVVPLNVSFGQKNYREGIDLNVDEFYDLLEKSSEFPKTSQPSPQDYVDIFEEAKKNGAIITFDPNLREPLWNSLDEAKEQILCGMKYADYLKISDNEIQWLTGEQDYTAGVHKIREQFNIPLITVSLGKEGSRAYYQPEGKDEIIVEVDSFLSPETIETTGAGDTFCGCIIHYLLEYGIYELDENRLKEMLTVANAAASLITRVKGALRVMPSLDKVNELAKSR
jgi:fructokinase